MHRHRCHILDLVSPTPERILFGPAVTISYFPSCSPAVDRYDFTAYCSGEATRWGGDHVTPFQANVPVVLDRVAVIPGHYVFADSSRAVVIPDVQIEVVLVDAADAAVRDQIARERFVTTRAGQVSRKKIIMSSASDRVPIPARPEPNFGGKTTR